MTTTDKLLSRRRVVAAQIEGTEGTAQALSGTENNLRVLEAGFRYIVPTFSRETLGDDFTPNAPTSPGAARGEITFTTELAQPTANDGDTNLSGGLSLEPYFTACNMQEVADTAAISLPAPWNTTIGHVEHGETIYNATETEGAAAVGASGNGYYYMWMEEPAGFSDWNLSDSIEIPAGGANGAFLQSGKITGTKISYRPDSSPSSNNSLTIGLWHDGKKIVLKGARGNWSMSGSFGQTVRISFTFQGVVHQEEDEALPTAVIADQIPPAFANVEAVVHNETDASYERDFEFSEFSYDFGNQLESWTDASSADAYSCTAITGRQPSLRVNPSHKLESAGFDWLAAFAAGDPLGIEMQLGTPGTDDGSAFVLNFSGFVITDAPAGDREGVEILDVSGTTSRGSRALVGDGDVCIHLA